MVLRRDSSPIRTFEQWKKEIQSEIDIALPLSDDPKETQEIWQKALTDYFGGTTYMPKLRIYDNPAETQIAWQKELTFALE
jgi:hypothetical protein